MIGTSPAPELPSGTITVMEDPRGHPPSVGMLQLSGMEESTHSPALPPQKSTEPKGSPQPAAWTRSQPFHPCSHEMGSLVQFQLLQQEELFSFFLPPPPPFFHRHDKPNRANTDPWPALCHDVFFLTVKPRSSGSCITRYSGKERFLSFFQTHPCSAFSSFPLSPFTTCRRLVTFSMKRAHVAAPWTAKKKEKETPRLPSPAADTCAGGRGRDGEERGWCLWSHAEPRF